jgi:hypothetical protein
MDPDPVPYLVAAVGVLQVPAQGNSMAQANSKAQK